MRAEGLARQLLGRRAGPGEALGREAARLGAACRAMAERFRRGGLLFSFGTGLAAADAAHVAVEFTHPVIVGKRALPAIALGAGAACDGGTGTGPHDALAARLRPLAGPADIALGLAADGDDPAVLRCLAAAREAGALTVALVGGDGTAAREAADHVLAVESADPLIVREIQVTTYHVLWELVHVFLAEGALTGAPSAQDLGGSHDR
ncbi:D-sedoheptulose 7-phosphate isomerase [Actinocorallia herbida]|uniref:D-sedoheptulose 7-phosphate isomerase n=1 Tax=Actinocorallia herbida TaxID=58109 RepID=A0A3N1CTW6_9ACTN|nr:SIS domain-containing protein [Actinocorallia herbida]ROO84665.1 D-sedoheptulose 7-phosphate isomerase [Actinocorallia herbida]